MSLLEIDRVTRVYPGGVKANDDVSLHVEEGDHLGRSLVAAELLPGGLGVGDEVVERRDLGRAGGQHGLSLPDPLHLDRDPHLMNDEDSQADQ